MSTTPILKVAGVCKTFAGRRPLQALVDVTLHVDDGEFVSIIGPSGSGKSTLFNLIAGIEPATSGELAVQGLSDADERRLRCGYMFQKDLLFPWRNLLDNAALGLEVAGGTDKQTARLRARELLPRFGLDGFETSSPAELSGGMRQRVALLRTLLLGRPLLLLDEPFASLDALTRRELQAWLRDAWATGSRAALLVTHDVREAIYLSDRVYILSPRPGTITGEFTVQRGPNGKLDVVQLAELEQKVLAALQLEAIA
jgi:ABC-type nitrate/sulfonate/bicarbonate transport system ATPase subunit